MTSRRALRGLLLAVLAGGLAGCSRVTSEDGPALLVTTVEQEGLRLEVRNHRSVSRRSAGFSGAGRGVGWYSAETRCGVGWTAEAVVDGARTLVHKGYHPVPDEDCDGAVATRRVSLCSGAGRVAIRDAGRDFVTAFRFGKRVFVGQAWVDEGGDCRDALAESWEDATYLAHSRAAGALETLLASAAPGPTVRCFLDYRTWEGGTSLAVPAIEEILSRPGPASYDPHIRFLLAVARGEDRTPDLEAALYAFLLDPPPTGPFRIDWVDDRAAWPLSAAPSRSRRLAYVGQALGKCALLATDDFRRAALAEAIAQLGDAGLTARARASCPALDIPERPARLAHLR